MTGRRGERRRAGCAAPSARSARRPSTRQPAVQLRRDLEAVRPVEPARPEDDAPPSTTSPKYAQEARAQHRQRVALRGDQLEPARRRAARARPASCPSPPGTAARPVARVVAQRRADQQVQRAHRVEPAPDRAEQRRRERHRADPEQHVDDTGGGVERVVDAEERGRSRRSRRTRARPAGRPSGETGAVQDAGRPRRAAASPAAAPRSRGRGHSTAEQRRTTPRARTRTRRAPARTGSAGPSGRRCRARAPQRAQRTRTAARRSLHLQLQQHLVGVVQLDLVDPRLGGDEVEGGRAAGGRPRSPCRRSGRAPRRRRRWSP